MDNPASLHVLPEIVNVFLEVTRNTTVVIVGNKTDLEGEGISRAAAEEFAQERGWPLFFTSAVTGSGVKEAFRWLAEDLMNHSSGQMRTIELPANEKKANCC
jgi:GTPase SAR1 family protein